MLKSNKVLKIVGLILVSIIIIILLLFIIFSGVLKTTEGIVYIVLLIVMCFIIIMFSRKINKEKLEDRKIMEVANNPDKLYEKLTEGKKKYIEDGKEIEINLKKNPVTGKNEVDIKLGKEVGKPDKPKKPKKVVFYDKKSKLARAKAQRKKAKGPKGKKKK